MAITWTLENEARRDLGISVVQQPAKAAFAASDYTTTGYTVNPAAFALQVIRNLYVAGIAGATASTNLTTTYVFSYNRLTKKLQAFGGAASGVALAEVVATTDLSAFTLYVVAEGF
jgi:hypothetical protein